MWAYDLTLYGELVVMWCTCGFFLGFAFVAFSLLLLVVLEVL